MNVGHSHKKTTRKKPSQTRAKDTVTAILEASAHILTTSGYDTLTTNRVATVAGVSIGSLYQYFSSKEEIVGELMDRYCDRMNALFGEVFLRAQGLSPRELTREVVSALYRAKAENPRLSRVLREHLPRLGRLDRLEESLRQITRVVGGYLTEHRALLRVQEPERAAFYAVTTCDGLTMASIANGEDPETAIAEIADIVSRYLFRDAKTR